MYKRDEDFTSKNLKNELTIYNKSLMLLSIYI